MDNKHSTLTSLFTDIANAIRVKTNSTSSIVADNFPDAIMAIPSGSSVIVGEMTQSTTKPTITIPNAISKDNVALMYMSSCNCPASAMEDAGITNIVIQGNSYWYIIHYSTGMISCDTDGYINYDKTTGSIRYKDSYNEKFIAGKYMYVVW